MTSGWIEMRSPLRTRVTARPTSTNFGGEFMAENLGQHCAGELVRGLGRDDRPAGEFVQVGAADAASERPDHHLAVAERRRRGDVLDPNVFLGVESDRLHPALRSRSSVARHGPRNIGGRRISSAEARLAPDFSRVRPHMFRMAISEGFGPGGRSFGKHSVTLYFRKNLCEATAAAARRLSRRKIGKRG